MTNNDSRYERKYPTQLEYKTLQTMVNVHPCLFEKEYPDRWINNIYFDDSNFTLYQETVQGFYHRKKIRLRWYHQINNNQNINLELKYKQGYLGHKKIYSFEFKQNILNNNHRIKSEYLDNIKSKRPDVPSFKSVIFNRYLRSYYKSKLFDTRLTIDRKIQFAPIYQNRVHLKSLHEINLRIIELKYDNDQDSKIPAITQHLPTNLNRCSKYGIGLNIFYSPV